VKGKLKKGVAKVSSKKPKSEKSKHKLTRVSANKKFLEAERELEKLKRIEKPHSLHKRKLRITDWFSFLILIIAIVIYSLVLMKMNVFNYQIYGYTLSRILIFGFVGIALLFFIFRGLSYISRNVKKAKREKYKEVIVSEDKKSERALKHIEKDFRIKVGRYSTDLDVLYQILMQKGKTNIGELRKYFSVSKKILEEWINIFEEFGLIRVQYHVFKDPTLYYVDQGVNTGVKEENKEILKQDDKKSNDVIKKEVKTETKVEKKVEKKSKDKTKEKKEVKKEEKKVTKKKQKKIVKKALNKKVKKKSKKRK